jgi:hypothetical protein
VFLGPGIAETDVLFQSQTVSQVASTKAADCVAQFGQLENLQIVGPLSATGGMVPQPDISDIAACAEACAAEDRCQFLLFDHGTSDGTVPCQIRIAGTDDQQVASNITL